jgi:hypothetical protein
MSEGKDFIQKHKPLTPDQLREKMQEQQKSKERYVQDSAELEKEIDNFNKITDPLVDPVTDKALCWVRRPTQEEWESLVPVELLKYRDDPSGIPPEVSKKYSDLTFELMAKIIEKPKHDSKWWKQHANLLFIQLFQYHLQKVFSELGLATTNF